MNYFMKFLDEKAKSFLLHVEITYNKTCDWSIYVCKKGCAADYPECDKNGNDAVVCMVQDSDMELAFAKAQVEVKEWLCNYEGGY